MDGLTVTSVTVHFPRHEKLQELRSEIEVLAQLHDKTLDRKNAVIDMLARDLDEQEEQYRLALRTHLQVCHHVAARATVALGLRNLMLWTLWN